MHTCEQLLRRDVKTPQLVEMNDDEDYDLNVLPIYNGKEGCHTKKEIKWKTTDCTFNSKNKASEYAGQILMVEVRTYICYS